jgi:hypothetical protein
MNFGQPNQPDYDGENQPASGSSVGQTLLIIFIVILCIAAGCVFIYFWMKKKEHDKRERMALDPESLVPHQELTKSEKNELQKWAFNPPETRVPEVTTEEERNTIGNFTTLKFNHSQGQLKSVITNRVLEKLKDNCYFEIELTDIEEATDVMIGLCPKENYNQSIDPGMTEYGMSLHSNGGAVYFQGKKRLQYGITAQYGETIGVGYHFDDNRVWMFYNGKFLNEPLSAGKKESPSKLKKSTIKSEEEAKEEKDDKAKELAELGVIKLKSGKKYCPVIAANGPCTITINIGGAPFRIAHREIAKGLL